MALVTSNSISHSSSRHWRVLALIIIFAAAGLRVAYFILDCPLNLAPDEAHYWDWSRRLDWSYYSKGPLVAWLIRLSCELFGSWSYSLTGDEMLAVRLPAVVCGCLLLGSVYVLTVQVFRDDRLAFFVVLFALTLPVVAAGSSLMTIDAPYTCCWGWALVAGHRAVSRDSSWAWLTTGLFVGLGILAKYTMVLFLPSLGLFLLTHNATRHQLQQRGFWLMIGTSLTFCLPLVIWNWQNDWVSLRHVGGQAGVTTDHDWLWFGPFAYIGTQAALLMGFWFVVWLAGMVIHRPGRESNPGLLYLWWLSAPMFTIFLLFSLKTKEQPNWPIAAYISGLVLAGGWLQNHLKTNCPRARTLTRISLLVFALFGFVVTLLMHRSDLAQPVLLSLSINKTEKQPFPLRRFDPTCRLRGWKYLGKKVDEIRRRLRREGMEPILVAGSWTIPGELAFYCEDHPRVYSLGAALGDRHSQYDLWRPNPVHDPRRFLGKTMIFVGAIHPNLKSAFQRLGQTKTVTYAENNHPIAAWNVTICRGFLGFAKPGNRGNW